MRVVFDTSVLVAAVRSQQGASYALVSSIPSPEFQLCQSVGLYTEWQDVLTRGEHLTPGSTPEDAQRFLRFLASQSHLQEIHRLWRPFLPDADDDLVREQGILAMKADQGFDAALSLDPSNWDARFTKAVAMAHWPTQMNESNEVMQHFATLEQQEAQTSQPHFAQTDTWVGDTYEKYGYADHSQQIWERGAALFPENQELRTKLLGR